MAALYFFNLSLQLYRNPLAFSDHTAEVQAQVTECQEDLRALDVRRDVPAMDA